MKCKGILGVNTEEVCQRTLVKVISIELNAEVGVIFQVVIPSWGTEQISVLASNIPDEIRTFVNDNFTEDIWLIAQINLSTRFSYALIFKNWELAPKLLSWDELLC